MTSAIPALPTLWELDLFVAGRPAAQGSKRHVGGNRLVEQSKYVKPWRNLIAQEATKVFRRPLLDAPLCVVLEFVMPRPGSTPKTRATPAAVKRPDLDKLQRAAFDALSEVVWRDDSQVVSVMASKRVAELGEASGVRIRVAVRGAVLPAGLGATNLAA